MTNGFWREREEKDLEENKQSLDDMLASFRVRHEGTKNWQLLF